MCPYMSLNTPHQTVCSVGANIFNIIFVFGQYLLGLHLTLLCNKYCVNFKELYYSYTSKMGCEGVDWIYLAQRNLVSTVKNVPIL
jgi:hypothetical protein